MMFCDVTLSVYPHRASLKNMPGHGGNRTYDLWNTSPMLCQLIPKVVGSIPTVAGHIFQARPVWINTQSNITKHHAVYSIPCGDCEKEYLGQSKRQFGTRLKEHQKTVSTLDKGKSALAEHVCYTKHEIAWKNSKVITTNNRYGQRLCLEAWHINMSNHALNREAYLPEEYLHLIGR